MKTARLKTMYAKDPETGCWLWRGGSKVWYEGKSWYPHRLLWTLVNKREIPQGYALRRQCTTEGCIAPGHHEATRKEAPITPFKYQSKKLKERRVAYSGKALEEKSKALEEKVRVAV